MLSLSLNWVVTRIRSPARRTVPGEHVADPELVPDLAQVRGGAAKRERGAARHDEQLGERRQRVDDVFHDAVAEVAPFRRIALDEWQHGDRRLPRLERKGRPLEDAVCADAAGDPLQLEVARVLHRLVVLPDDQPLRRGGRNEDAAGSGKLLQPAGDVDGIALKVAVQYHGLAPVDPPPHLECRRRVLGLVGEAPLRLDQAVRAPRGRTENTRAGRRPAA